MSKEDQYKNDSKTFIVVDELKEILNATYNQAIDDAIEAAELEIEKQKTNNSKVQVLLILISKFQSLKK